jgi:hypothetical protein
LEPRLEVLRDMGIIENYDNVELNVPIPDSTSGVKNLDNGAFMLDRAISGQYLITTCELEFIYNKWIYTLTLNKPADQRPEIIKIKE